MATSQPKPALHFPHSSRTHLNPYLPSSKTTALEFSKPFVTLTFATSLDSSLSLAPGTQTILSGPETKAMTHYLRSQHEAILVGVGTAVADNPALNCRIEGVGIEVQPRPVILDPRGRFKIVNERGEVAECVKLAREGKGKGPWIVTSNSTWGSEVDEVMKSCGGGYIQMHPSCGEDKYSWPDVLKALSERGIKSLMIEGGAYLINTLLQEKYLHLIDSVIVTIAPVWLGQGGVVVSPPRTTDTEGNPKAAARLKEVKWQQYGEDVVMCGRIN